MKSRDRSRVTAAPHSGGRERTPSPSSRPINPPSTLRIALALIIVFVFFGSVVVLRISDTLDKAREAKSLRTLDDQARNAGLKSYEEDIRKWLLEREELQPALSRKTWRSKVEIERVPAQNLSFRAFFEGYEKTGKPVVITQASLVSPAWTRAHIKKVCGDAKVFPVVPAKVAAKEWANLVRMGPMKVSTFLDFLKAHPEEKPSPYMHDWSLPKFCPDLLRNYVIPKYFSQDYLRLAEMTTTDTKGRVVKERQYKKSWPSLFIGEKGTGSGLHIDSGDTHFVMYMIEGEKEFRLLRARDRIVGYEIRGEAAFAGDLFAPDFEKHPLLALATLYTATLRPGDLLFVPGGSAHQVVNHSPVISISTNFVDASNVKRSIQKFNEQMEHDTAEALKTMSENKILVTQMDPVDIPFAKAP